MYLLSSTKKNCKHFPQVPVWSVCSKLTLTMWCCQFLEVNLQGHFLMWAVHLTWRGITWDMAYVWCSTCVTVTESCLWSLLVFETSYCYVAYNRSLWWYMPLPPIFVLVLLTRIGIQFQTIVIAFLQDVKSEWIHFMKRGDRQGKEKCVEQSILWWYNCFILISVI
jgi:hypothetical protein